MLEILQWSIPVEKTQSPPLIDLFFPQTSPFFCTIHAFDEISWVLNEFRVMVSQFKGDMCAKFPRKRTPRQCYLTKAAVDHFTWKLQQNLALNSLDFLVLAFSTPSHKESQLCDSKNSAFLLELAALFWHQWREFAVHLVMKRWGKNRWSAERAAKETIQHQAHFAIRFFLIRVLLDWPIFSSASR